MIKTWMMRPFGVRTGLAGLIATAAMLIAAQDARAQVFEFAGYSWEQSETPDVITPLSPGPWDGAIVTALPVSTTTVTSFPVPTAGFDASLSLGRRIGLAGAGTRGVNLPAGNFGTTARSGFLASWTLGRRMYNRVGTDFVIYESGSVGEPEGLMVQVRSALTSNWSRWLYLPPQDFELFAGSSTTGLFVFAYELETFGVGEFDEIDGIRVVNMTDEDRIDAPGTEVTPGVFTGSGFVLPEDAGATSVVLPSPGVLTIQVVFDNSTLDPDPLYIGSIAQANTCGDGDIEAGEECDDGNAADLDGCSSECRIELLQSVAQRRCIVNLNLAASAVADIQDRVSTGCLRGAGNEELADAQICLVSDGLGRVQKKRDRLGRVEAKQCSVTPDFGFSDALTAGDAAVDESVALVGDLFGADLQAATIRRADDPVGFFCQLNVLQATTKLASASRRQFQICKAKGLREGRVVSEASLEACLDELQIDPRAQVFRGRIRLANAVAQLCSTVPQATAFPGRCAAAANVAACLQDGIDCRVCRMFNAMDALTRDCDAYDDGTRNGSCPLSF